MDIAKLFVLLRQLVLGISGTGVVASIIPPETVLAILNALDKIVTLGGEIIPLVIFVGTTIYGLFFGAPAKALEEKKDAA